MGVECTLGHVTGLDLSNADIGGVPLPQIQTLQNLRSFKCLNCSFTGEYGLILSHIKLVLTWEMFYSWNRNASCIMSHVGCHVSRNHVPPRNSGCHGNGTCRVLGHALYVIVTVSCAMSSLSSPMESGCFGDGTCNVVCNRNVSCEMCHVRAIQVFRLLLSRSCGMTCDVCHLSWNWLHVPCEA